MYKYRSKLLIKLVKTKQIDKADKTNQLQQTHW